jgi:glycerate dehydrogenase
LTWGIVGYGNIGKAVAKVAAAFGANILVNKRTRTADVPCVDIDELCKESDIISLHCPLTESTRGLIDARAISLMKKSAVLVNEARGAVVDEKAVRDAVKNGKISGFGCEVYSTEPDPKDHPYNDIAGRKNVILTPHVAWGAYEARVRCLKIIIENIKSYYSGARLNRVDTE